MCKTKNKIVFCSCNEKISIASLISKSLEASDMIDNKEEYNKRVYYWFLERTIRKRKNKERNMIMGELYKPSKKLDEEVTAEFVIDQLNNNAEFDFNYIPEDGDELLIGIEYKYTQFKNYSRPFLPNPMKFIYQNEEWFFGEIDHFEYKQIELGRGKMKLNNNE